MIARMSQKEWAQQERWLTSPAKKLYEEAARARADESFLLDVLITIEGQVSGSEYPTEHVLGVIGRISREAIKKVSGE